MSLKYITTTPEGHRSFGAYSLASITESGIVKVAGQIGVAPSQILAEGIMAQTHQTLRNVGAILREAECDFSRVTMVSARLASAALAIEFNSAYREFIETELGEGPYPPRETILAGVPYPGALVEITTEAMLPPAR